MWYNFINTPFQHLQKGTYCDEKRLRMQNSVLAALRRVAVLPGGVRPAGAGRKHLARAQKRGTDYRA